VRASRRMAVLLGLVAAAAATITLAPPVREERNGALHALPSTIGDWLATEGAPEWALPIDPNENVTVRQTYRQGERIVWVSVAFFSRQDDPSRRNSLSSIYPEVSASRIDRFALPITLDGASQSAVSVPAVVIYRNQQRQVVVYWHQLGRRAYGSEYKYRLALMREVLFQRRADTLLVRVAIPLNATQTPEDALTIVSEIAPPLYAALIKTLLPIGKDHS